MTEETEDFKIGGDAEREPETDCQGLYYGRCFDLVRRTKTPEDISREVALFGKDPEKVNKHELIWKFETPDLPEMEFWMYTGTYFGEKAKATDVAAALTGRRPRPSDELMKSQLVDKGCQLLIEWDAAKSRNKLTKVMPPKRAAAASETKSDGAASKAAPLPAEGEPGYVAPMDDAGWGDLAKVAGKSS